MEGRLSRNARTFDMQGLYSTQPMVRINEEKNIVNEVSWKEQPTTLPDGCALSSQLAKTMDLLCNLPFLLLI